ncbi:MAG: ATP-binding protein [Pseudomonadales bacterium]|nr:ATP-binding protein [Pseudomonadales bacterium]
MATEHATGLVICVTGPESTGKTTLARELAATLAAPLVPEAARVYLAGRRGYDRADVLAIARMQLEWERTALERGAGVIVADTDLTVFRVWWEERFGTLDPWLEATLGERSPRRYLLARPDLPWEPDPLRESPHDRERLFARYRAALAEDGFPHAEIGGSGSTRLAGALEHVRNWLAQA